MNTTTNPEAVAALHTAQADASRAAEYLARANDHFDSDEVQFLVDEADALVDLITSTSAALCGDPAVNGVRPVPSIAVEPPDADSPPPAWLTRQPEHAA